MPDRIYRSATLKSVLWYLHLVVSAEETEVGAQRQNRSCSLLKLISGKKQSFIWQRLMKLNDARTDSIVTELGVQMLLGDDVDWSR